MKFLISILTTLMIVACGQAPGSASGDGSTEPKLVGTFAPSDSGHWQAQLNWTEVPRYSDQEFLEMTGTVVIHKEDGSIPSSISNVSFTADMPQHGHGTGNILPTIAVEDASTGTLRFGNLLFTMTGSWRIRVSATVDGKSDTWTETVEVQ